MKILVQDAEGKARERIEDFLRADMPTAEIYSCADAHRAQEIFRNAPCDVAFLAADDAGMELARRLMQINDRVNLVFYADSAAYALEAFRLYAVDYIIKPAEAKDIASAMAHLRYPVPLKEDAPRIRIQCLGHFEVFAGEEVLTFRRSKAKELLAYLVTRAGAECTMGEIMAALWEQGPDNASRSSNLRNVIGDLRKTLRSVGADNILIKARNSIRLDCNAVKCDYFDSLRRGDFASEPYRGEFMVQYSWAERTAGNLAFFLAEK